MNRRALVRITCMVGIMAAILFVSAGRTDLPFFWLFLGADAFGWIAMTASLDPGLLEERLQPAPGGVDRGLRAALAILVAAHLVIAGLDAGRFSWSRVPIVFQSAALAGLALAGVLTAWAEHVNSFFSPVVRIQSERGHHLITDGPYRFVRHPGYLGASGILILCGPALGSWWAVIPNLCALALILRRAVIEDRFLHDHLCGYVDYAKRVRYRIVPGLW